MIGNVFEWYDFAIYGYFAASIGRNFFPREDSVAQLLAAFGVFALGYLVRPIGGALIGHIGDCTDAVLLSPSRSRLWRFQLSLLAFFPATRPSACWLPSRSFCCAWSRLRSGKYNSSMVFLVERASVGHRGVDGRRSLLRDDPWHSARLGSWSDNCRDNGNRDAGYVGGWRIPFLLQIIVGIVGFILRRHVAETAPVKRSELSPIVETLRYHWQAGRAACRAFSVQRGKLLCDVRLCSELATNR